MTEINILLFLQLIFGWLGAMVSGCATGYNYGHKRAWLFLALTIMGAYIAIDALTKLHNVTWVWI